MNNTFSRQELQALITKAKENLNISSNPEWKLAYQQFILACSTLDAFEARASVPSCALQGKPLEIGTNAGYAIPQDPCKPNKNVKVPKYDCLTEGFDPANLPRN